MKFIFTLVAGIIFFPSGDVLVAQVMTTNLSLANITQGWSFSPPLDANTKGYMTVLDLSLRGPYNSHGDIFTSLNRTNLIRITSTVDAYAYWYRAEYGQEFSPNTVASFVTLEQQPAIPDSGSFYLGVQLNTSPNLSAYGWGKFQNSLSGELTLLDSGVTYNNSGVIIGSITPTPEPSGFVLLTCGLISLIAIRRF